MIADVADHVMPLEQLVEHDAVDETAQTLADRQSGARVGGRSSRVCLTTKLYQSACRRDHGAAAAVSGQLARVRTRWSVAEANDDAALVAPK